MARPQRFAGLARCVLDVDGTRDQSGTSPHVVPAKAGTHSHRRQLLSEAVNHSALTTCAAAYGSPGSRPGRRGFNFNGRKHLPHAFFSWHDLVKQQQGIRMRKLRLAIFFGALTLAATP